MTHPGDGEASTIKQSEIEHDHGRHKDYGTCAKPNDCFYNLDFHFQINTHAAERILQEH